MNLKKSNDHFLYGTNYSECMNESKIVIVIFILQNKHEVRSCSSY
jgi:hypothetical protein